MHLRLTRPAVVAALALATITAPLAVPLAADAAPSVTAASAPTFGALLDWSSDNAQQYAQRLDATPGQYGTTLGYPLSVTDTNDLLTVARAAAAQGADVVVQLRPRVALSKLTTGDADNLATKLDELHQRIDVHFQVDFAPDMNASWTAWGQQPTQYVRAFRTAAQAVHRGAPDARMVWHPSNGAGYPYDSARGEVRPTGERVVSQLDTDGNGRVDARDDPYRPYWPGSSFVDRVALSVFWYGPTRNLGVNALPTAGWLQRSLAGTIGYSTATGPGRDFVAQYAVGQRKPMTLETSAVYVPSVANGPSQAAIDRAWIAQVFAPSLRSTYPTVDSVLWLEQRRADAEAGGAVVDWRATTAPADAAALRAALVAQDYPLGPVPSAGGVTQADTSVRQVYDQTRAGFAGGDRLLVGLSILLGLLLLAGVAERLLPRWRYPRTRIGAARDDRIDMLRGFVMALVILTHVEMAGPGSWFASRIGAITGAEMFVLLSGIVMGALYPLGVARFGELSAATGALKRAGTQYFKTAAVILLVFFLSLIPFVDTTSATTFVDRGTGSAGPGAVGRVYDLLGTAHHLLDYPPPAYAIHDFVLLRWGPWPMNIMGLFVVLSLTVPAALWLLRRRLWWLLLAVSWALYVVNAIHHVTLFGAQFEAVFPLLSWQVMFVHGLVIGYYRTQIYAALVSRLGKVAMVVVPAVAIALLALLRAGVSISGLPAYQNVYAQLFERTYMEPGRLFDLVVFLVATYALLTTCWTPLSRAFGAFLLPLGRMSLRVFFIQVFLVIAVGNIPGLDRANDLQGLAVHVGCLLVAWLIVREWPENFFRRSGRSAAPVDEPAVPRKVMVPTG